MIHACFSIIQLYSSSVIPNIFIKLLQQIRTWSKIIWHFKIVKFFQFFMKNGITLEQKTKWTWNSSCNYISWFCKAWSFIFFKKVLVLGLLRKICCSASLFVKNTIEAIRILFEWKQRWIFTFNFGQ